MKNTQLGQLLHAENENKSTEVIATFGHVRIEKDRLIDALKKNREKHIKEYEEALADYKKAVIAELEKRLEKCRNGEYDNASEYFSFDKPENHTEEYNRTIALLEYSVDMVFTLTIHEFNQYVRDEWSWKGAFNNASMMYKSALSTK